MQRWVKRIMLSTLVMVMGYQVGTVFSQNMSPASTKMQQSDGIQLPYIVHFSIDPADALTLSEVEAGQSERNLSWQVSGLTDAYALALERFSINQWEALQEPHLLSSTGTYPLIVQHPANFGPPTYRLLIRDAAGTVYDERYITLPYAPDSATPQVTLFTADLTNLDEAQLQAGTARIPVLWEVENRPPLSNLVFEQIRDDGTAVSIEPPRQFAWVASSGQGEVVPLPLQSEPILRLRIRLINTLDHFTIHEQYLAIPIGESSSTLPVIQQFSAAPASIEREGEITVTWDVTGATVVFVAQVDPDGALIRASDEEFPASGTKTYHALPVDFYSSRFVVYAGDGQGKGITQYTSVAINCPYTYFFGPLPEMENTCPLSDMVEVQAAHQLYERGEMMWRADRQEILVLYLDGTYEYFADTYEEGEALDYPDDLAEPPTPAALPIRGFGKVWVSNPQVREKLGWANAHETIHNLTTQAIADGKLGQDFSIEYLTLPTGQLIGLYPDGAWHVIEIAAP